MADDEDESPKKKEYKNHNNNIEDYMYCLVDKDNCRIWCLFLTPFYRHGGTDGGFDLIVPYNNINYVFSTAIPDGILKIKKRQCMKSLNALFYFSDKGSFNIYFKNGQANFYGLKPYGVD